MVFCLVLLALSIGNVQAARLGLRMGVSSADQSYNYSIPNMKLDRLHRIGLAAGLFAEFPLGNLLSVRAGADYVEKGSSLLASIYTMYPPVPAGTKKFEDHIDYLTFSLLAKISPLENSSISPYIVLGPRLDVLLSSSSDLTPMVVDDLKSSEIGGTAGLGVTIPVETSVSILFEALYSPDFSSAFKGEFLTVRNSTFQFMTGLQF